MTARPISRRRALGLAGLGAASVMAGMTGWIIDAGLPVRGGRLSPAETGEPLRQPEVVVGRDGILSVRLAAAAGVRLAGLDTSAWGYNGTSPGPTLRVRPGDLLRVQLVNQLGQPTNLHTHGLKVSPQANGDNPFIAIDPGAEFDYEIRIPPDHPPGTFWYHPHHHGNVADQIFAGLAGALLVEGGPDLPVSSDRVLLVTDTTLDAGGHVVPADAMARMQGREGDLVLVNGQHEPVIAASAGSAERWRVINGCVSRVLALRLDGHRLTQIALDGSFLAAPIDRDQVVLAPGNRVDVIVRPAADGRFALLAVPYDRGSATMMGGMAATGGQRGPVILATLVVTGSTGSTPPLPTALPAPTGPHGPVARQRRLTLAMGMGTGMRMGMGMGFTIDGRTFEAGRDDQIVTPGTTEEWTVVNTSPMDHPFHLHGWPFHVMDPSVSTPPATTLQDVVLVPAYGQAGLRIPFTGHSGRSVYHCHILDHEDLGMMGTVNVRDH
ncbi:multicopper oxidase family protein [Catellatospora coxensis]|uniref:Multicopper oxidase n=1 Tax=Catellatospora coxensis TaxID=310354 RepID=A0A8J3L6G5_9ACTN|nr:multicopper oxidase family protein [Catellatospora coxensis]GIG09381.1 multicopper oxidase [Catellatospora coxensis]